MKIDTSERGLERLICTALTGHPCDPPREHRAAEARAVTGKLNVREAAARLPDSDRLAVEDNADDDFVRQPGHEASGDPEKSRPAPDVVDAERSEALTGALTAERK